MEETFDTILTSLLEAYENNLERDIDELIAAKCEEWNLTEEEMVLLKETNEVIDDFTEKAVALEQAKQDGKSRKRWILEEIDRITEGHSEEEKAQIVSALSNMNEKIMEEITAKE